jgi:hypothetical protein
MKKVHAGHISHPYTTTVILHGDSTNYGGGPETPPSSGGEMHYYATTEASLPFPLMHHSCFDGNGNFHQATIPVAEEIFGSKAPKKASRVAWLMVTEPGDNHPCCDHLCQQVVGTMMRRRGKKPRSTTIVQH